MTAGVLKLDPNIVVKSVILWLDEGNFPENLHIVCLCHNK